MSGTSPWWRRLSRVATRPRPWILRYCLHLLPALVLAVLIAGLMLPLFRRTLVAEALRTRSLGDGLEIVQALDGTGPDAGLPVLGGAAFLGLALLAWLPIQIVSLYLEGGVLHTYAAEQRPDRRAFGSACRRTFKPFLVLGLAQSLATGAVVGIASALGAALDLLLLLGIAAALVVLALMVIGELARAVIVIEDDRHVFRALGGAMRVIRRRFGGVAALVAASGMLHGFLFFVQRAGGRAIPIPWWALSLAVQQGIQALGAGVRLARQAGMVGLAWEVREHTPSPARDGASAGG